MSNTHTTLDAAATDRKARLAKLASLKRKQPGSDTTLSQQNDEPRRKEHQEGETGDQPRPSLTDTYLSGRNYDVMTKGPKLGFENLPTDQIGEDTVEAQAARLSLTAAEQAARDEAEAEAGQGIDLFKLQPRKANWDLKRDLAERTRVLDVRTQNAIARLVRERIETAKKEALKKGREKPGEQEEGEEVGLDGNALVEGVHLREREEEEEERRERELQQEDAAIS